MDVEEYEPISTLKVPQHPLTHSKFPFIDVHNHQWIMPIQNLDKLIVEMDSLNMAVMVNLSGFRGKVLEWSLDNVHKNFPNRFIVFMNINFENLDDEGWPHFTQAKALPELDMIEQENFLKDHVLLYFSNLDF